MGEEQGISVSARWRESEMWDGMHNTHKFEIFSNLSLIGESLGKVI